MRHCEKAFVRHGVNPNGSHLRLCGEWRQGDELPLESFVGLLIYGLKSDDLCPDCVDHLEFKIKTWREGTMINYRRPR